MKNFYCSNCGNKVYFENVKCLRCEASLGFDRLSLSVVPLTDKSSNGAYRIASRPVSSMVRYCANATHRCCNWLVDDGEASGLCVACGLNRTIPNLNEFGSLVAWRELERAKKRLIYSLLRFDVPIDATVRGQGKLTFDFLRDASTGHLDGVITIDVLEADAVERERQRQFFGEPYRTLLGHLRHESGHFYWRVLVESARFTDDFRRSFGDEREDYALALQRHYASGPATDWQDRHVSPYASSHPWEDWAETWAHYMHMVDAVDTAESEGMEPRASGLRFGAIWSYRASDAYLSESVENLIERWIPLATALNSLNRSMGHEDYYPFVLSPPVLAKFAFVHRVLVAGRLGT